MSIKKLAAKSVRVPAYFLLVMRKSLDYEEPNQAEETEQLMERLEDGDLKRWSAVLSELSTIGLQHSNKNYSRRSLLLLKDLNKHFEQTWQKARAFTEAQEHAAQLCCLFTQTRQGVILLNSRWRIIWMSELAQSWMGEYFECESRKDCELPTALKDWLGHEGKNAGHRSKTAAELPLTITRGAQQLRIHRVAAAPHKYGLLMSEDLHHNPTARASGTALGLTHRENQILHWLMEGKNNPEIGIILGSSPNTVRKHVEHILAKLGVESRGAAARRAWEMTGSHA